MDIKQVKELFLTQIMGLNRPLISEFLTEKEDQEASAIINDAGREF